MDEGAIARKQRLDRILAFQQDVFDPEPNKNSSESSVTNGCLERCEQPTALPAKFVDSLPAFYKGVLDSTLGSSPRRAPVATPQQQSRKKTSHKAVNNSNKNVHRSVPYDPSQRIHPSPQRSWNATSHKNGHNTQPTHVHASPHSKSPVKSVKKNSPSPFQVKADQYRAPAIQTHRDQKVTCRRAVPPPPEPVATFGSLSSRWTGCLPPPPPKPISPVKSKVDKSLTNKAPPTGKRTGTLEPPSKASRALSLDRVVNKSLTSSVTSSGSQAGPPEPPSTARKAILLDREVNKSLTNKGPLIVKQSGPTSLAIRALYLDREVNKFSTNKVPPSGKPTGTPSTARKALPLDRDVSKSLTNRVPSTKKQTGTPSITSRAVPLDGGASKSLTNKVPSIGKTTGTPSTASRALPLDREVSKSSTNEVPLIGKPTGIPLTAIKIEPLDRNVSKSMTNKVPPTGKLTGPPPAASRSLPLNNGIKSCEPYFSRSSSSIPKQQPPPTKSSSHAKISSDLKKQPQTTKPSNHGKQSSIRKKKSSALPIVVKKLCKTNSNSGTVLDQKKDVHVSKVKETFVDQSQTKNVVATETVNHASTASVKVKAINSSQSQMSLTNRKLTVSQKSPPKSKPSVSQKSPPKSKSSPTRSSDSLSSLINKHNQPLVRLVPLKQTQELMEQVRALCSNSKYAGTAAKKSKVKSKERYQSSSNSVALPVTIVKTEPRVGETLQSPSKQQVSPMQKRRSSGVEVKDGRVQLPIAMDQIKLLIAEQKSLDKSVSTLGMKRPKHNSAKSSVKGKRKQHGGESLKVNGAHPVGLTRAGVGPSVNTQNKNYVDSENSPNSKNTKNCETTDSSSSATSSPASSCERTPPKRAIPKLKTRSARLLEKASASGASAPKLSVGEEIPTVITLETTIEGQVVASVVLDETKGVLEFVSTSDVKQDTTRVMVRALTCHICLCAFHCFDTYQRHKWSHHGVRRWSHRYRRKTAKKKTPPKQFGFRLVQHSKRPYMCETCGKNFVRRRDVIVHMRTHTGEKPFVCHLCSKGFTQNSQLKRHLDSHSGQKPFACDLCGNCYSRKDGLKRHMVTHSGLRPYSCNLCGATFTYSSVLAEHMAQHRGDKPHKCNVCPQTFIKKIRLIEHERIHSGVKPFICDICNAGFTVARLLNCHRKIHAEVKPFTCDVCSRGFTQKGALLKHAACHSSNRPWKCDECGKAFAQQQYLKNHMKIHSDVKPYKCVHCGWGFRDKTSHVRHERLHTGVRPYKCKRCEKSFNRSTHLKKHMQCHEKYDAIRENNLSKETNEESS